MSKRKKWSYGLMESDGKMKMMSDYCRTHAGNNKIIKSLPVINNNCMMAGGGEYFEASSILPPPPPLPPHVLSHSGSTTSIGILN